MKVKKNEYCIYSNYLVYLRVCHIRTTTSSDHKLWRGRRMKYKDTMKEMNCSKCGVCIGKSFHYFNDKVFWCFRCSKHKQYIGDKL